jgi:hypothetical protein
MWCHWRDKLKFKNRTEQFDFAGTPEQTCVIDGADNSATLWPYVVTDSTAAAKVASPKMESVVLSTVTLMAGDFVVPTTVNVPPFL